MLDWQLTIGALTMGPGTDYVVSSIVAGFGIPDVRNGDTSRPVDDGDFYGRDFIGSRAMAVVVTITAATAQAALDDLDALIAEWQVATPDATVTKPLIVKRPGRPTQRWNGRPRRAAVDDSLIGGGIITATLEYVVADPRLYADALSTLSTGAATTATGQPNYIQAFPGTETTQTASLNSASPAVATTANNALIATIGLRNTTGGSPVVSSVTDTAGNTWRLLTAYTPNANTSNEVWWCPKAASIGTGGHVTVNASEATSIVFEVVEVGGLIGAPVVDIIDQGNGNGTSPANTASGFAYPNELALSSLIFGNGTATVSGQSAGWNVGTLRASAVSGQGVSLQNAYEVNSDPNATLSFAATLSASTTWCLFLITFTSIGGTRTYPLTFPRVYGSGATAAGGSVQCTNAGNKSTRPVVTITGPCNSPVVWNDTTGEKLATTLVLGASDTIVIDFDQRTVTFNGAQRWSLTSDSVWWELAPGTSQVRFTAAASSGSPQMSIAWRSAWIG